MSTAIKEWAPSRECCDAVWEAAYARFETPEQEIAKFVRRLRGFGAEQWDKHLSIVELFCGRGSGLVAWQRLGFSRLEGVDISASLLRRYTGTAQLYQGDCRCLQLASASRDVICVQGGLHHLPTLPDDLVATIEEVARVLRPGGRFVVVEPWRTPFLDFVHTLVGQPAIRRMWGKLDALGCMIERERETYFNWLGRPREILGMLGQSFEPQLQRASRGKLCWLGIKRS